jgi:hypothetical protein
MEFLRFYWAVFRESFRHSLDIAQAVMFVVIIVGGVVATENPRAKVTLDQMDLGGWKAAAIVLGSIILIRLLLAPYWLYQSETARRTKEPQVYVDFGLRCDGFHIGKDEFTQVNFLLKNTLDVAVQYEVDEIFVILDDKVIDGVVPDHNKWIVSANTTVQSIYPRFPIDTREKTVMGSARIVYKFGQAGSVLSRRATFAAILTINPKSFHYARTEDSETSI